MLAPQCLSLASVHSVSHARIIYLAVAQRSSAADVGGNTQAGIRTLQSGRLNICSCIHRISGYMLCWKLFVWDAVYVYSCSYCNRGPEMSKQLFLQHSPELVLAENQQVTCGKPLSAYGTLWYEPMQACQDWHLPSQFCSTNTAEFVVIALTLQLCNKALSHLSWFEYSCHQASRGHTFSRPEPLWNKFWGPAVIFGLSWWSSDAMWSALPLCCLNNTIIASRLHAERKAKVKLRRCCWGRSLCIQRSSDSADKLLLKLTSASTMRMSCKPHNCLCYTCVTLQHICQHVVLKEGLLQTQLPCWHALQYTVYIQPA